MTPGGSRGKEQACSGSPRFRDYQQHLCSSLRFANPLTLPSSTTPDSQEEGRNRLRWRSKVRTRGPGQRPSRPPQTKGRTQFCPCDSSLLTSSSLCSTNSSHSSSPRKDTGALREPCVCRAELGSGTLLYGCLCAANTSWSLFMQEMGPLCQKVRV